jgi:peptide-methionine (S)-S-oxide reductase
MEQATLAAGCFWGVEAELRAVPGVVETQVGYTGGTTENPTYEQVCSGRTGHAEAVWLRFDPERVSYEKLLDVFWKLHDPTTMNRQGPDIGSQYRSAIFFHDTPQQIAAEASRDRLAASGTYRRPIVTQIVPAVKFYPAEEYHQRYLEKNGLANCHVPGT